MRKRSLFGLMALAAAAPVVAKAATAPSAPVVPEPPKANPLDLICPIGTILYHTADVPPPAGWAVLPSPPPCHSHSISAEPCHSHTTTHAPHSHTVTNMVRLVQIMRIA